MTDDSRAETQTGIGGDEVLAIVRWLQERGVTYQINGGWAVDALHVSPTRSHRDVDVFLDEIMVPPLLDWLHDRGYETVDDQLPVRIELRHGYHVADLHPMRLDSAGNGLQQGVDGAPFHHPVDARTVGRINGQPVVVATPDRLRELHQGYEPRSVDRHDLAVLDRLQATFSILTNVTDAPDPMAHVHAADQWDSRYSELDQVWSGNPNAALVTEVAGLPTGTALDIGCGEGADAIWLAVQGWQVTAIDVSAVAMGRAQQAGSAAGVGVDWQVTSLAGMPDGTGPFELVTAFYPTLAKAGGEDLDLLLNSVAADGTLLFVHHADIDRERALAQVFDPDDFLGVDDVAAALGEGEWDIVVHESRERDVHGGAGAHHHSDLVLRARRLA